jgi:hypothetical protein
LIAPLILAFFISAFMAGGMGIVLRHESRKEIASLRQSGFWLMASGHVTTAGAVERVHPEGLKITADKTGEGEFTVMLWDKESDKPYVLPDPPLILVGMLPHIGSSASKRGALVKAAGATRFVVQTLQDETPISQGFWFLVLRPGYSP